MCNYFYAASARKLMLTAAAVLILVFCVGVVSYAQTATVTGTATINGKAYANTRVAITSDTFVYYSALTDSNGAYSIANVPPGNYMFTFNALQAVREIDATLTTVTAPQTVIPNRDLQFGMNTEIFDNFAATIDPMKWTIFDAEVANPIPYGDTSATSASVSNGRLSIMPHPQRGGIITNDPLPAVATYGVVFPCEPSGFFSDNDTVGHRQTFTLTQYNYSSYISAQDRGTTSTGTDAPVISFWKNGVKQTALGETTGSYPAKVDIVKTYNYFDCYVNGVFKGTIINDQLIGTPHIYLNGNEYPGSEDYADFFDYPTIAYFEKVRGAVATPAEFTSISEAKTFMDRVVTLNDVVVTASFGDAYWVESTDRSSGIKIVSGEKPPVGRKVIVQGWIERIGNEIVIQDMGTVVGENATAIPAVGITGKVAAELDKAGAAAQGLLVKVAGKVTEVCNNGTYVTGYYLDDGSGLPGDGAGHKGIFVKVDTAYEIPSSAVSVGDFKVVQGPLTTDFQSFTIIPAVRLVLTEPSTFLGFNDVYWYANQPNTKITTYNLTGTTNKYLRDYNTGDYISPRVTITSSGMTSSSTAGENPASGDALNYFKVNDQWVTSCVSVRYGNMSSWFVKVQFSGLDPNGLYEYVCTSNAKITTSSATTKYFISGLGNSVSATYVLGSTINGSSSGTVTGDGGASTTFNGYSNPNGYVARWYNIKPAADGTFTVNATAGAGSSDVKKGCPYGVFRLQKQSEAFTQ